MASLKLNIFKISWMEIIIANDHSVLHVINLT